VKGSAAAAAAVAAVDSSPGAARWCVIDGGVSAAAEQDPSLRRLGWVDGVRWLMADGRGQRAEREESGGEEEDRRVAGGASPSFVDVLARRVSGQVAGRQQRAAAEQRSSRASTSTSRTAAQQQSGVLAQQAAGIAMRDSRSPPVVQSC
jgi:hypothetical protein